MTLAQLTSFGANNPHYPARRSVKLPEVKIQHEGCLFEGAKKSIFIQKIDLDHRSQLVSALLLMVLLLCKYVCNLGYILNAYLICYPL